MRPMKKHDDRVRRGSTKLASHHMRGKGTKQDKISSKGETDMIFIIEIDRQDRTHHSLQEGGPPAQHVYDQTHQEHHLSS